ncbi:50S ribosomal protein L30e-like protein [Syncephalastrum racemosum]|uniref:H/ACA ribonucleoprotein complex subunit 2 n=1 Tax=Syncephalastrum racemosum TaxID=13706 RepID=A0A1X2HL28_SYNRA|nr:50S ribosomal protein L30e-like protein [Syncephalastrum racemosum]
MAKEKKDKKDKKEKKEKKEEDVKMTEANEVEVERWVSPIAHPLADKKLSKKLFKTVTGASKVKHVRRGVKEVQKALRKGEKGLVVLAADVSPIDVTSHFPVFCEEKDVPYIFVTSREQLGQASSTRRPTSVAMVVLGGKSKDMNAAVEYKSTFDECLAQAKDLREQLAQ